MYEARNKSPADAEVIEVLTAISHVSARLARKLTVLATQSKSDEGGKHYEQNGDMAMTIEELRNAAAAINDAADWLSRQFRGEPADGEPTPAKEPELKLEDVRAVLADMSRKGHTAEIRVLLQKYGAAKLSGVDPANYSALLKDVEELDHAE